MVKAWNDNVMNDEEEAIRRAILTREADPFHDEIYPALLSSAEIADYVRETGMLCPFHPKSLKSASYEAHIGGELIYWDSDGERHSAIIKRGDQCRLLANSITFVQVEPQIRLPNYIALRFNLRITHVHRGLLLGTGPLVDPGFEGKLLIPLHNLTDADYYLDTTEALIWIEFTKTTFKASSLKPQEGRTGVFSPFRDDKKNKTADYYLSKANHGLPIRSSIGGAIDESRNAAVAAEKASGKVVTRVTAFGFLAFFGLAIALSALTVEVLSLIQETAALLGTVTDRIVKLEDDILKISNQMNDSTEPPAEETESPDDRHSMPADNPENSTKNQTE